MSDTLYYIGHLDGSPADQLSQAELEEKIRNGTVTADSLICRSGWPEWKKCGELPKFRHCFVPQNEAKPKPDQVPLPTYTVIGAFLSCIVRYTQFRGRSCRSEFWKFVIAVILLDIVAFVISEYWEESSLVQIAICTVLLFTFMPMIAVTCRRLHDAGKSGLWMLAFLGCNGVGGLVGGLLQTCLSVCALVCLISVFRCSEPANRFGKAPAPPLDMEDVRLHMTCWKREAAVYGLGLSLLLSTAIVMLYEEPYMQEVYECPLSGMTETEKTELYERVCSAAESGNAEAECAKGYCLLQGIGTKQNPDEAFDCFRHSSEHGYAKADACMALCYTEGLGVQKDPNEAFRLAQIAAGHGDLDGYVILGMLHANGIGCEQNPGMAVQLFETAANAGYANGMLYLAQCYALGFGVEKDMQKAKALLEPLAERGRADARQLLNELNKQ